MGVFLVEGFEVVEQNTILTASTFQALHLAMPPDTVADWFADAGSSVSIVDTDYRISGQSMQFVRSDLTNNLWDDTYGANLGFSFLNRDKVTCGCGFKYNKRPDSAIPLMQFRLDDGSGENEQLSLWASPDGRLFFSANSYVSDITNQLPALMIPEGATPSGVFRFTSWQYLEVMVDYTQADPTVSVQINGEIVVNAAKSAAFKKLPQGLISSVSVVNPTNTYFTGGFTQHIDDMYLSDGNVDFAGPQQVMLLKLGATVTSEWAGGGALISGDYVAGGVAGLSPSADSQTQEYLLEDLPAGIDNVTAVGVHLIASISAGVDGIRFGLKENGTVSDLGRSISVQDANDQLFRFITGSALPNSLTIDVASVNDVNVFMTSASIIG